MAITRLSNSGIATGGVLKYDSAAAGYPPVMAAPTAADGGTGTTATVSFTAVSGATTYTALSSPGSFTATGASSPLTVSGLTAGTAYTFQIRANNSVGSGPYSAASNSVTPVVPSSFESIASVVPSGTNTVTFSSIPQTYTHLQLRMTVGDVSGGSNNPVAIRVNGITSSTYFYYRLGNQASTPSGVIQPNNSFMRINNVLAASTLGSYRGNAITTFFDYTGSSRKTTQTLQSLCTPPGPFSIQNITNYVDNTNAITSITVFTSQGDNFTSDSSIALYGIKGS